MSPSTTRSLGPLVRLLREPIFWIAAAGCTIAWIPFLHGPGWEALRDSRLHEAVDALALCSAFIAIAFAFDQFRGTGRLMADTREVQESARQLVDKTNAIARDAQLIAEGTSTRYIGEFPHNMRAITELIGNTSKSLVIVCDTPGYGHFSDPVAFIDYQRALVDARLKRRVSVRLMVYDEGRAHKAREEQLGLMAERGWEDFKHSPVAANYFDRFPDKRGALENPTAFARMIDDNERRNLQDFRDLGVQVTLSEAPIPLFMWISDDRAAIICFLTKKQTSLEHSFVTRDPRLINALPSLCGLPDRGDQP